VLQKQDLKKQGVRVWNEFNWLRIASSGEHGNEGNLRIL
jgi:hypothetical protein